MYRRYKRLIDAQVLQQGPTVQYADQQYWAHYGTTNGIRLANNNGGRQIFPGQVWQSRVW